MRLFLLLVFPLLLSAGCLAPLVAHERDTRVQRISRFDTGCGSLQLVEQMGHYRYKLRGCGRTYVYACEDRPDIHQHGDAAFVDLLLTGGADPNAPCHLVMAQRDPVSPPSPQRPVDERPPRDFEENDAPAPPVAKDTLDEPGATGFKAPGSSATGAARLPRLPDPAEVKRAMSRLEPELRRCGLPRTARLQVRLQLAASGEIQRGTVVGEGLDDGARRCVEQQLVRARVTPFRAGPMALDYLLDLR